MRVLRPAALAVLAVLVSAPRPDAQGLPFSLFERYLESLREQTGIPGISAVIVQGGDVVWQTGLGKQDVERSVATRDDTPYPIGDLTQTFAAVLVGQCVESAGLNINQPIRRWTDTIPEGTATLRHVLSHASSGVPGEAFRYDPGRYAALTNVVSDCADRPFRTAVYEEIFDRLGMRRSVPGRDLADAGTRDRALFSGAELSDFTAVLQQLATPYRVDRSGKATRSEYPAEDVNAATGLVSTAQDLARFDAALDDDGALLRSDLLSVAWNNVTTSSGAPLPSGLGWFVQSYNGERLVWHFGVTPGAASSLLLKVPRRGLTLILLANSDGLSPSSISEGDVTASLFAKLFLRVFVG
jgi:CubicO group peptidase (beta-lactamase class C family)